jgi:hypothetical protein
LDPTTIYTGYLSTVFESVVESRRLTEIIDLIRSEHFAPRIQAIRSASDDERSELKEKTLPAFFPTLLLTGENTLNEQSRPTGIVQFDVDNKEENENCDFAKLREEVIALPETVYAFTSPTNGLKFGLLTDFHRAEDDSLEALKSKFIQAYGLVLKYVRTSVSTAFIADSNIGYLKRGCLLSSDAGVYFNPNCRVFSVYNECRYSTPKPVSEPHTSIDQARVTQWLGFIPQDFRYHDRLPINGAVLSELGEAGIPLLLNHWTANNKIKLERDIRQLLKGIRQGGFHTHIGVLYNQAIKNGLIPPTGRQRSSLMPTPTEFTFEPLLTPEQAETRLKDIIEQFFADSRSRFINFSTGAGKTYTVLRALEEIDPFAKILYLVKTHELAQEITDKFNKIRSERQQQRDFKAKVAHKSRMDHLKGRNALCENSRVRAAYRVDDKTRAIAIPADQCSKDCELYASCRYIQQFGNRLGNIRVMMFNEYFNEPTRWSNGVDEAGNPSKRAWEPDFIIIDENIFTAENDWTLSRSSPFPVIAKILDAVQDGKTLEDALNENRIEILKEAVKNKPVKPIDFKNAKQYLRDLKHKPRAEPLSPLFDRLKMNAITEEASYLQGLRVEEDRLVQSVLKPPSDRHRDIPTLYLDATANPVIINRLLPDVEYHPIRVKAKPDINVYQLYNKTLTQKDLSDEVFLNQVTEGLKSLCGRYKNPGLITYKNIPSIKNFDAYLADRLGIGLYEHFGNLRGVNKFDEVDCLIVLGRYCVNANALESFTYAIFNHSSVQQRLYVDSPVRLKDGTAVLHNSLIHADPETRAISEHFSLSETQQALGRGRLIHGQPKDIFVLSNEHLGRDIEITRFMSFDELFPVSLMAEVYWKGLNERGFVHDRQQELMTHLGLTKAMLQNHRDEIEKELLQAGFQLYHVEAKDQWRKARAWDYFVEDKQKLELHLASEGFKVIKMEAYQDKGSISNDEIGLKCVTLV